MFDDGSPSSYAEGFAYMNSKGIVGTEYVATSFVGDGSHVTSAQLVEMNAAGWAIGNHTKTHATLTSLSQAAAQAELTGAANDLTGWELAANAKHVAYPSGLYNDTVLAAMDAAGMLTGRTTNAGSFRLPLSEHRMLPCTQILNTTTLDEAKALIDTAMAKGMILPIVFHELVASPSTTYEWAISDFQALIDYVVTQSYACINIADLYGML